MEARLLTRTAVFLALTLAIQSLRLGQAFTGPLVNAMLYLSVAFVGILSAVLIGAITPWVALAVGILKLAPLAPFIMVGNASLAIIFGTLQRRNKYLAVIAASVVKFVVLASAVKYIVSVPPKAAAAFGTPQLLTALGGGLVAIIVMEGARVLSSRRKG